MKKAIIFSVVTIAISTIFAVVHYNILKIQSGNLLMLMRIVYMWIPAIVAIVMTKKEGNRVKDLGIKFKPNKWFIFAVIIFIPLTFLVIPVNLLFPSTSFSIEMSGFMQQYEAILSPEELQVIQDRVTGNPTFFILMMIIQSLAAGLTINAVAAFGEELGWRGYLYKALESWGFWRMSLFIGFIWGIWHGPVIMQGHNYPSHPIAGVFMMTAFCILISPLFTFIRFKTGSVIAASFSHGVINAIAAVSIMYILGGNEIINGIMGVSGFIVLAIVNLILYIYLKRTHQHISLTMTY
ncbi:CAAX protease self-immunity [Natronincola peptidivorans]|uniref:CAAX protease self-immunity n=1 Tax=Natronincola peptidivorans TaxID=426128 RepID=A0A1I0G5N3_9FIRM|nr:CPBP family intramembrane glutamic endopeptidase [Natronincola peptidivorans]SET65957.1 CAAX protease self-immunity [Natronincola peptidivorans]